MYKLEVNPSINDGKTTFATYPKTAGRSQTIADRPIAIDKIHDYTANTDTVYFTVFRVFRDLPCIS